MVKNLKRLTTQEEKYSAEFEDALKQFSEFMENTKDVYLAGLSEQRIVIQSATFKIKAAYRKNLIRLSCLTASMIYLNYWKKNRGTICS